MTSSDRGNSTAAGELAEQVARWRAAGLTEAQIEKLLRPDVPPPQASQTAASFAGPQAPMSGAVGNVGAAIGYAQGVIPAVQKEMATAGDKGAPATRRFLAFGALVLIAALVVAIGYGISLELSILQNQAKQTAAAARSEAAKADALNDCTPSDEYIKAIIQAEKDGTPMPPRELCNGR